MCNHEYEVVKSFKFDESMSTLSPDQIKTMVNDDRKELRKRGIITICKCNKCGNVQHIKTLL